MNRKILRVGPVTMAISLPMDWAKRFNLKPSEELDVEIQGNSLRITTKSKMEEESATVNVTELYPISTKIIGMLYKAGYKKIKAIYTPNKSIEHRGKRIKELDMIRNTFDHLIGMQLWDLGKKGKGNYATVVESAKLDSKEFGNVLNKLILHVIHQSEHIYSSLQNKKDTLDETHLGERLINQTADFCIKILVSHGHEEPKKTLHYFALTNALESIGDKYFKIGLLHHNKVKIDKTSLKYLEKSTGYLRVSASLYRKFDMEKAKELTREIHNFIVDFEKNIQGLMSYQIYSILSGIYELMEIILFLNYNAFKS